MNLIDTHSHLQFQAYDEDRKHVVKRNSRDLAALITVGTSIDSSKSGLELAKNISNFYAAVGVHPHHVGLWSKKTLLTLESLLTDNKVVAVGEIGLDNHVYEGYPKPNLKDQTEIMHEQINLAIKNNKPVLFHCRDAYDQLYKEIELYGGKLSGLIHCYMGTWDQAKKYLDLGLYISFSGNITYKRNDYIREVAKNTPDDRILVETDAPFLPPEGRRGMRNEPIYVKIVAAEIAKIKGWSEDETAQNTSQNATKLLELSL